jgi:hypothetical protein
MGDMKVIALNPESGMTSGTRQKLLDENLHLREELKDRYKFANLVGTSGPMRQLCEQVAQVARTTTTVLIRGESGTGAPGMREEGGGEAGLPEGAPRPPPGEPVMPGSSRNAGIGSKMS